MSCLRKASDLDGLDSNRHCCNSIFVVGVQEIRDMGGATVQQRKPRKPGKRRREVARREMFFAWPPWRRGEKERRECREVSGEAPVGVKMTLHCAVPCHLWKTKQLLLPDEMRTLVSEGLFLLIGRRRNKKGPAAPA